MIWVLVALGMAYGFLNGMNDSGSLTAAIIGCSGVGPRKALLLTAAAQFVGALVVGVAVARSIGAVVASPELLTAPVVMSALAAAIGWSLFTGMMGLPSSASHALIGALAGAAWLQSGVHALSVPGLAKVLVVLFISPWIGFVASYLLMKLLLALLSGATPRVGGILRQVQWVLVPMVAAGHGANDAQKVMGIVALGLVALHRLPTFAVPPWLQIAAAASLAAGTSVGGLRIMRTLSLHLYRIRPIHGFAAQAASTVVVLTASILGGPVSTTQVVSASIAGAGSAQRFSQVRWKIIGNIVVAWLLTIPAAGALAALLCAAFTRMV